MAIVTVRRLRLTPAPPYNFHEMRAWLTTCAGAIVLFGALLTAAPADTDVTRALDAARARAEAGDAVAQFSLGAFLFYGSSETGEGVAWIRRAAAQRFADAEFQLGQIYEFGFGASPDTAQALTWYRRAAEHGSAAGQRAVAEFYRKGGVVAADAAEAARWYRRAADGDDLRAQFQLGQMYFDGVGVSRDYASAFVWFSLAAAQTPLEDNRKGLLELRNIAAARMDAAAVASAKRRVAAWRPPGGRR
jgi:hypothetical protein